MHIYYCVLKKYKGLFKKKHVGNTHLFFIPISDKVYLYLGMIGELTEDEGTYATQLITRLDSEMIDQIINEEEIYFKDRYIVLEKIKCKVVKISPGEYKIKILNKGKNVLSDIHLEFEPDNSTNKRRIYLMSGRLNLNSEDILSTTDLKMVATKQMAFMGDKTRFESFQIKNKFRR